MAKDCFWNGDWVDRSEIAIDPDDLGFLMGVSVSERLRTFGHRLFALEEHLDRLAHSLRIVGLPDASIVESMRYALPEVVAKASKRINSSDDLSVVVFVTPGKPGPDGPTVCAYAVPLPFGSFVDQYRTGQRLCITDVHQVPPNCWPAALKCRSRMHFFLADNEARDRDPLARALLLDQEGTIAEVSTANIVAVIEGEILTPHHETVLAGVSLATVRQLAEKCGVPMRETRLSIEELANADEAMLTSTSSCLVPVASCDGKPMRQPVPGPVFTKLMNAWSDLVGVDIIAQALRFSQR